MRGKKTNIEKKTKGKALRINLETKKRWDGAAGG